MSENGFELCQFCGNNIHDTASYCKDCNVYCPKKYKQEPRVIRLAIICRRVHALRTAWNLSNLLTLFPEPDLDYLNLFAIYFASEMIAGIKIKSRYDISSGVLPKDFSFVFPTHDLIEENPKTNFESQYDDLESIRISPPTIHQPPVASSYYSGRVKIKLVDSRKDRIFEVNQFQWIAMRKELPLIAGLSKKVAFEAT